MHIHEQYPEVFKVDASIYRKKSIERIESPEKLDAFLQVPGPKFWWLTVAVMFALSAALIWFVFGQIPIAIEGVGYKNDNWCLAFVEASDAYQVESGMKVVLTYAGSQESYIGTVKEVFEAAHSEDVKELIDARWLVLDSTYVSPVSLEFANDTPLPERVQMRCRIIVRSDSPLEFLMENKG